MKILVTGGLGFIGHNVVALLESAGHDVVIVDNKTTYGTIPQAELDYLVADRRKKIKTELIYPIDVADGTNIDWLVKHQQPDLIIHLASFPRQKVVNANPHLGSRVMSEGLLNLLEASVKHQVKKFVYASSSMVYGDFVEEGFDGMLESAPTNPLGQYGIMKLSGEWLVRDYTRRCGLVHTIVRPSAVYGPGDVEDRVISKFMLGAMRGETLKVNGSSETLDFTYVADTARGIAMAAVNASANNNTYNITRGQAHTLLDAAKLAVKIAGRGSIEVKDRDASFPTRGALSNTSATNDFGYEPTTDIEQGFKQYYDWLANSVYWSQKTV